MCKKAFAVLLPFILLIMLTGCVDARDINDLAYTLLVGVDRGVSDKFRVTYKIPAFKEGGAGSGSGGGGQPGGVSEYTTLTIDAPSFYAALELANTNIPRTLNFMHTQFIVMSEELAESGLAGEFLAPIIRNSSIRYSTRLLISRGTAEEFVKSLEAYAGSDIIRTCENLAKQSEGTSLSTDLTLHDLYDCLMSTYHQPIAVLAAVNEGEKFKESGPKWGTRFNIPGDYYAGDVPRRDGNKVEILGLAIFNGDRMVGKLTGHESRLLSMAKGIFKQGIFTIPDPKRPEVIVALNVRPARKPEVKVWFEGQKPCVHLKLYLEGDILSIQSRINYENLEMLPVVEEAFERFIKTGLDRTIEKTRELNCDVFKFGHTFVKKFGTIQEWEAYDWNDHYKEIQVTTEVEFNVRRTGTMIYSSQIRYSEENK